MAGPSIRLRVELRPAVKGAWEATVGRPWSHLVPRNSPVAGRDTPPIGRVSGSGLSRAWVVFEPRPHQPLRGSDLGLGYELGLKIYCPVMPLPQSSLNPMCTYPDVLLYILLFPCFRVARILKRFVT